MFYGQFGSIKTVDGMYGAMYQLILLDLLPQHGIS